MFLEAWSGKGPQKGYKGGLAPHLKNVGTVNVLCFLSLWNRYEQTLQKMSESPWGSWENILQVSL